jgi:hypothetical protein
VSTLAVSAAEGTYLGFPVIMAIWAVFSGACVVATAHARQSSASWFSGRPPSWWRLPLREAAVRGLAQRVNFGEPRQHEVRRICLPRTRVNQPLGPNFSNVLPP